MRGWMLAALAAMAAQVGAQVPGASRPSEVQARELGERRERTGAARPRPGAPARIDKRPAPGDYVEMRGRLGEQGHVIVEWLRPR